MQRLTDAEWDRLLQGLGVAGDALEGFSSAELDAIAQGLADNLGETDRVKGGESVASAAKEAAAGEPWDRQPAESARAYEAFCAYRDLGTSRSQAKVAAQLGKSPKQMGTWSSKYAWGERVDAWDRFLAEEKRKAHVEAVKKMEERHARLGEGMQTLAARKLQRMLERTDAKHAGKQEADAALDAIEMHDMRALIKDGSGLERVARGEPETITEERQVQTWADAVVQRRRERQAREEEDAKRRQESGDVSEDAQELEGSGGSDG